MLSEPVARMTSPAGTSEDGAPHDISTDETYPRQTMRIKKRSGSAEPVDVTKIVWGVERCYIGFSDIEPLRTALLVEEPQYVKLAARFWALSNGARDNMGRRGGAEMSNSTGVVKARGLSQ